MKTASEEKLPIADSVLRLFPGPQAPAAIEGLYLAHGLHRQQGREGRPYLYTNFITSLDGRIAVRDPASGMRALPAELVNSHDQQLYLELAAQADVLLTTSRHLRAYAAGRHDGVFSLHRDTRLTTWRKAQQLSPEPAIAAVSEKLEIPISALRERYLGPLFIVTGLNAPAKRIDELRTAGVEVVQLAGEPALDGLALALALRQWGFGRAYSIAGPRVTHALLSAGAISRLYLTSVHLALGGRDFDTFIRGDGFSPAKPFSLHELYFDPHQPFGTSQLFASFDLSTNPPALA